MSLRVFCEDLTVAGRQAAAEKQRKGKSNGNAAPGALVPEELSITGAVSEAADVAEPGGGEEETSLP